MNYITTTNGERLCEGKQFPKVYGEKPNHHYLKTNARKDMLDVFFRSGTFKNMVYANGISMFIEKKSVKQCWKKLPFDFVHYTKDK